MTSQNKTRVAIDAMGGDYAPGEIVKGALRAMTELGITPILVGQRQAIECEMPRDSNIEIVDTPDVIAFTEQPAFALKEKPRASIRLICELVKQGQADVAVTMGHTGAGMIGAITTFGRIAGAHRPAVGVPYLNLHPNTFLVDAGANVDCKPEMLAQFGVMGSVFVERVLGVANPTVALLTNGREDNKGDERTKAAYKLLKASGLNFIGNVEGYDLPRGTANVVVADGMIGNVALKLSEALGEELLARLDARIADASARAALVDARKMMDYAEIGAVPLLGVNGLCLIGHGRSRADAVVGAMRTAMRVVGSDLPNAIREGLQKTRLNDA